MRKQHKNNLDTNRIVKVLKKFSSEKGYDVSESEPFEVFNHSGGFTESYTISIEGSLVVSASNGLEIEDLETKIENIVKAAFITGTFVDNSENQNASYVFQRRYANDEEHRIMLLYKFNDVEFYFIISVMGIVVTIEPEGKGDEIDSELFLRLKSHADSIAKIVNDELINF